jgi:molecular chaperone GrpE
VDATQASEAARRLAEVTAAYRELEADRQAFRRRLQQEHERLVDVDRGQVALGLIEAADDLERSLRDAPAGSFSDGLRLIHGGLLKRAAALGVEPVALEGHPFDPNFAEAAGVEVTPDEAADGRVLDVLLPCYALKGRVVRPGRVRVGRYVPPAQA